ncbi:MAG TPA: hypothetical protein VFD05_00755 [Bacilli bacterium]|nr:hypothetical protein [Bacilli bacterium]
MYKICKKIYKQRDDLVQGSQNEGWVWTDELKTKFLAVGEKLYTAISELLHEVQAMADTYTKELENKTAKYYDFEIDVFVLPSINPPNSKNNNKPPYKICQYDPYYRIWRAGGDLKEDLLIDRTDSWNIEDLDNFKEGEYIPYYVHNLICHLHWRYIDVINIDHLWVHIHVYFQRKWRRDKHIHLKKIIKIKEK